MGDWKTLERSFTEDLGLVRRPVAVSLCAQAPSGVARFQGAVPSGCSFWRLAAAGQSFVTLPGDHANCAIGAYTHNLGLPEGREKELEDTLGLMFQVGYIRPEEVPGIPRLQRAPANIVYAPLGEALQEPDVVVFACGVRAAMLLTEAAQRAGAGTAGLTLGRPTCMGIPVALAQGTVASLGCIGNRVYTDVGDEEVYVFVPGKKVGEVAAALQTIVAANQALADYARGRRAQLATL